jgi:hypothetical protein
MLKGKAQDSNIIDSMCGFILGLGRESLGFGCWMGNERSDEGRQAGDTS